MLPSVRKIRRFVVLLPLQDILLLNKVIFGHWIYSKVLRAPLSTLEMSNSVLIDVVCFFLRDSAAWPKGQRRCFYDDPDRMTWIQPAPWLRCFVL